VYSFLGHRLVSLPIPRSRLRHCLPRRSTPLSSSPLPSCPRDPSLTCTRGRCGRGCARSGSPIAPCWCRRSCGRAASPSDVANVIVNAEIDSVGIVAGRRDGSLNRPSAVHPRLPARVPCIPRTLAIPRWLCRVHAAGSSCSGGSSPKFANERSRRRLRAATHRITLKQGAGQGSERGSQSQRAR
jgi:hypothetical protein